ncbi:hypothetical protein V1504DRAFT_287474 [Lipomyces starkeyi]
MSGIVNLDRLVDLNNWSSYHAAPIFPLSGVIRFITIGFSRWIISGEEEHGTGMYSWQNGLLMLSHIHENFVNLNISINPDDDYRIIALRNEDFQRGWTDR